MCNFSSIFGSCLGIGAVIDPQFSLVSPLEHISDNFPVEQSSDDFSHTIDIVVDAELNLLGSILFLHN